MNPEPSTPNQGDQRDALTLIPCISLWQPWAQWVMLGWKPIETRTHTRFTSLAGKTTGIHASQHWDKHALAAARPYLSEEQIKATHEMLPLTQGQLLGTVHVNAHRLLTADDSRAALIDCASTTRWGLITASPKPLAPPLIMRGMQGIFWTRIPRSRDV